MKEVGNFKEHDESVFQYKKKVIFNYMFKNTSNKSTNKTYSTQLDQLLLNGHKGHTALFGRVGSGKTHTTLIEVRKAAKCGRNVIIIGEHGEYNGLVKGYGGTIFDVDKMTLNTFRINRDKLEGGDFKDKVNEVFEYLRLLTNWDRWMSEKSKWTTMKAIEATFRVKGINEETTKIDESNIPSMLDFNEILRTSISGRKVSKMIENYIYAEIKSLLMGSINTPKVNGSIVNINVGDSHHTSFRGLNYEAVVLAIDLIRGTFNNDALLILDGFTPCEQVVELLCRFLERKDNKNVNLWITAIDYSEFIKKHSNLLSHFWSMVFFKQHSPTHEMIKNSLGISNENAKSLLDKQIGEVLLVKGGLQTNIKIE